MTAQKGDIYRWNQQNYTVVALSSPMPFHPKDHGLHPEPHASCCWRGYWCEYDIDEELVLKNLYLYNSKGQYPDINGVSVSSPTYWETTARRKRAKQRIQLEEHLGHRLYRDVDLPIAFTGSVLAGSGFLDKYYIHMGFQKLWAYEHLMEFTFEDGILVDYNDYSHIGERLRQKIEAEQIDIHQMYDGDALRFVEDCFSLDYRVKAWWEHTPLW